MVNVSRNKSFLIVGDVLHLVKCDLKLEGGFINYHSHCLGEGVWKRREEEARERLGAGRGIVILYTDQ